MVVIDVGYSFSVFLKGVVFWKNDVMADKEDRDIEKGYANSEFVDKLRRLADAIENEDKFEIQIAGERIYVPVRAVFNIEHEREDGFEEIEFQIKWSLSDD